ncbi:MAG: ATP-binding protein, partial [Verrucomicrobiota bacterium]
HQGVGIGLALVKEIIAKHNGTLSVDSELDHGTKFTIRLPLPEIDANASLAPVARPEVPSPSEPMAAAFKSADHYVVSSPINSEDLPVVGQGPTSILVVDDEPDMRRFLVSMLSGEHTVFQAADGDAGIRIAEAEKPDLILLDWMLPGKHGLEVCQILRANDQLKHLKIILLTAKVDEASKIRALQQGADDFLTKPFSSIEVKTRIATQLDTLELQRNLQSQNVELEQTLRELRNTEAKLIQSEKINSLGVLSAGLLHEVNNPLNYTMTALHFLKTSLKEETFSEESSEEIDDTLVDIDDGMQRIKKIVSDLHTFAYPEKESSLTELYVSKQVESALRLLAHELKDIKLEIQVAESSVIRGSATQFIHVLLNLISNSAKAVNSVRETRTPIIRIKDRQENDSTFIEIWDNGSGIKPENLTRIFDPFFTTRDVGAGMGMGLSICHTIVKNHHGVISCDSKVGEWTSMTIELPNDPVSKPYEKTNQLTAA